MEWRYMEWFPDQEIITLQPHNFVFSEVVFIKH